MSMYFLNPNGRKLNDIWVRDYLLAYDNMVEHYGELKRKLAKSFRFDSEGYCQSKDAYMKRLESMALQWYNNRISTSSYL